MVLTIPYCFEHRGHIFKVKLCIHIVINVSLYTTREILVRGTVLLLCLYNRRVRYYSGKVRKVYLGYELCRHGLIIKT